MITVITEHATLIKAKTRVLAHGHLDHAGTIVEAINRNLGDTTAQLRSAIDDLIDPAMRMHAGRALEALHSHAATEAHLDDILAAAALLPADIDTDTDTAALRMHRESNAADLTRNLAVLTHALGEARAVRIEGERCPECGTIAPGHGTVHIRYAEGGGGINRRCSRATESSSV